MTSDNTAANSLSSNSGEAVARRQGHHVGLWLCWESVRLVRALLDGMPEGPINSGKPIKLPIQYKVAAGQTYVAIETARGELGTWLIADGSQFPYRLKIRPPSLHALGALPHILPGGTLSDAVATLGSLDPIMGEVDR